MAQTFAQLEAELQKTKAQLVARDYDINDLGDALFELLDSLGAMSDPSELCGHAIDLDRAKVLVELARKHRRK